MKRFNLIFKIFLMIFVFGIFLYWFNGYDSAFEADQICHYQLNSYSAESKYLACDHDIETHQWILYEKEMDDKPAIVIKRFRYKFL